MIEIFQRPAPESEPTKNSEVAWRAVATVNGQVYEATSRHGASCALARVLVGAGVEDQPVQVYDKARKALKWRSLHEMAGFTYGRNGRKRWDDPAARIRQNVEIDSGGI